ncbi:uncharacterized protein C8A04DRAFT_25843 [Dichotomopilus funicola]|uniref:Cyclin-dependent kinase n=1 Tax=Dichotomopilus funicola TaxID=1934379 RepID=A0AAN6ZQI7_9PEZI|nr:hypothetical protein C8A04DRAFT_25843 [Dichotomopilus funicola]
MNTASPTKRRVLGALDPNACSPNKMRRHEGKLLSSSMQQSPVKSKLFATPRQGTASPARGRALLSSTAANSTLVSGMENQGVSKAQEEERGSPTKKRRSPSLASTASVGSSRGVSARVDTLEEGLGGEPVAKRPCLENKDEVQPRRAESPPSSLSTAATAPIRDRSVSPDATSVFDNSIVDNSQATVITEPDIASLVPATAPVPVTLPASLSRPRMTREQARQKAEILRLRLGLASYKVRTNQTEVSLDALEARAAEIKRPARNSFSAHGRSESHGQQNAYPAPTSLSASFPPPGTASSSTTRGGRRPLPAAPVRRPSMGVERGPRLAAPSRSPRFAQSRPATIIRDEQRWTQKTQNRYTHQQPRDSHHRPVHCQPVHHHQRHQSEVLPKSHHNTTTRDMSAADPRIPPRPRRATDSADSLLSALSRPYHPDNGNNTSQRRVSFVGHDRYQGRHDGGRARDEGDREADRETDMEDRGGAASGLLSLARS